MYSRQSGPSLLPFTYTGFIQMLLVPDHILNGLHQSCFKMNHSIGFYSFYQMLPIITQQHRNEDRLRKYQRVLFTAEVTCIKAWVITSDPFKTNISNHFTNWMSPRKCMPAINADHSDSTIGCRANIIQSLGRYAVLLFQFDDMKHQKNTPMSCWHETGSVQMYFCSKTCFV